MLREDSLILKPFLRGTLTESALRRRLSAEEAVDGPITVEIPAMLPEIEGDGVNNLLRELSPGTVSSRVRARTGKDPETSLRDDLGLTDGAVRTLELRRYMDLDSFSDKEVTVYSLFIYRVKLRMKVKLRALEHNKWNTLYK